MRKEKLTNPDYEHPKWGRWNGIFFEPTKWSKGSPDYK